MPLLLAKEQRTGTGKRIWQRLAVRVDEVIAFCPKCKTLETLFFEGFRLTPTQKFIQKGSQIYHDCGSDEPCFLYRAA